MSIWSRIDTILGRIAKSTHLPEIRETLEALRADPPSEGTLRDILKDHGPELRSLAADLLTNRDAGLGDILRDYSGTLRDVAERLDIALPGDDTPPENDPQFGFMLKGIDAGDASGGSVSSAGDVNGDGVDDILIGAGGGDPNDNTGAGETYVVYGRNTARDGAFAAVTTLDMLDGTNGFVLNGIDDGDRSGSAVSAAGDVNADGADDFLIGAPDARANRLLYAGEAYLVFGKRDAQDEAFAASVDLDTLENETGIVLYGLDSIDHVGGSVSSAGDVNDDGVDDVIIGARGAASAGGNQLEGVSYAVFGRQTSQDGDIGPAASLDALDGTNGFTLSGINSLDFSGDAVSRGGDINGDGIDDILIGAPWADPDGTYMTRNAGQAYVVFGRNTAQDGDFDAAIDLDTLNGANGFLLNGRERLDVSGFALSAGDINGDGIDDTLIGAPSADTADGWGGYNVGEAYVVFGRDVAQDGSFEAIFDLNTLNGVNGFKLNGPQRMSEFGYDVSALGDANGDGIDDILIGAPSADADGRENAGQVFVVLGRNTEQDGEFGATMLLHALDGTTGFVLNGIDAGDEAGSSVASGGDVNGDGIDDILIGASRADPDGNGSAGETYVVFGGTLAEMDAADGVADGSIQLALLDPGLAVM